jgi:hypothetical protein
MLSFPSSPRGLSPDSWHLAPSPVQERIPRRFCRALRLWYCRYLMNPIYIGGAAGVGVVPWACGSLPDCRGPRLREIHSPLSFCRLRLHRSSRCCAEGRIGRRQTTSVLSVSFLPLQAPLASGWCLAAGGASLVNSRIPPSPYILVPIVCGAFERNGLDDGLMKRAHYDMTLSNSPMPSSRPGDFG